MSFIQKLLKKTMEASLISSCKERGQEKIKKKLMTIVPDLSEQYSFIKMDVSDPYVEHKMYGQHAFQISLAIEALDLLKPDSKSITVVDIGDSAGTHSLYLKEFMKEKSTIIDVLSVNLDPVAIEKIENRGLKAKLCRAEDFHKEHSSPADIFLSFEMLEHLLSPIEFMHEMATKSQCQYFVITVPYVTKSRLGQFIDNPNESKNFCAENTHIFELSPKDWDRLFRFSGWRVLKRDRYTQYPLKNPLYLTKKIWEKFDFNGFYGVILEKDLSISQRYQDW